MAECSWATDNKDTECDPLRGANLKIRSLESKLERCHVFLDLMQKSFEAKGDVLKTMHAFRLLTKRVENGDIEELLQWIDLKVTY